jgi:hypothetical protein
MNSQFHYFVLQSGRGRVSFFKLLVKQKWLPATEHKGYVMLTHFLSLNWSCCCRIRRLELVLQIKKIKVSRNRPGHAQGFPSRLRSRIFLTFGTTRVVGRQPYAPAAFTQWEIFRGWFDLRAHGSVSSYGKNPQWHHRESIPRPSD